MGAEVRAWMCILTATAIRLMLASNKHYVECDFSSRGAKRISAIILFEQERRIMKINKGDVILLFIFAATFLIFAVSEYNIIHGYEQLNNSA